MHQAPSPVLAAGLSLLFPGLGQAYAGRTRRGALLALPALLVVAGLVVLVAGGLRAVLGLVLDPARTWVLLVGGAAFFVYHAAVIVDAHRIAARAPAAGARAQRRALVAPVVALLVIAVAAHGLPWYYVYRAAPGLAALFHAGDPATDWVVPTPSWAASTPRVAITGNPTVGPTPVVGSRSPVAATMLPQTPAPASPSPTPFAGPAWARDGQLNMVLIGSDEGPGRWSLRPDAIFLLSVDIETAQAALFAFPRYMSNIPLPPEAAANFRDGRFTGYFNALYVAAQDNPRRYPGNDARGLRVVAGAVQELTGVGVDHYLMVNLNGFVQVIEAMGGMWVDIPEPGVFDDRYRPEWGTGHLRIRLREGCRRLDGTMALAFVRSRHQDSDIHRLGRQAVAMVAVRRQFDPLEVAPRIPELFDVAGDNLYWTLTPDDVGSIAELAARVNPDRIRTVIFSPPEYKRELNDEVIEKIRGRVRGIFDEPLPEPSGRPDGSDCPPET